MIRVMRLGLDDTATEGKFLLGSGETPSFTNWAKGQPKNWKNKEHSQGEDCACLNIKERHKGAAWAAPKNGMMYFAMDLTTWSASMKKKDS